jgi:KUP system potassium uptake protein
VRHPCVFRPLSRTILVRLLHGQNIILSVVTFTAPFVPDDEKIFLESFNSRFSRLEIPNIPGALVLTRKLGLKFDIMSTSFLQYVDSVQAV